jgi:ubiquinone/menaquinone biosynthesis C-methylase UbiE
MVKIAAFDSVADLYDGWYKRPQGKQVFQAEREAVNAMIPETGLGLEIGAGTGVFAESLTNDSRTILCLDPSIEMTGRARERGLYCILGVGEPLPIRSGILDFCYMVTVIEFLDEPVEVFKESGRVAKLRAPLTILFINSDSKWGELYRNLAEKDDPVFKYARLFTLQQVSELLKETDYEIVLAKGTLNSEPMNQIIDQTLVEPSPRSGTLIVKSVKKS